MKFSTIANGTVMKKLQRTMSVLALFAFSTLAYAQMPSPLLKQPQQVPAVNSKALEDLLLCKPTHKFTRKSAERAFSELGLVRRQDENYYPASKNQNVAVFGATVIDASIDDESDQASLSVRVDRSQDDVAKQLGIKKQRVNGPFGPQTVYRKSTSQKSYIEISPASSISPRAASIDCVIF
ncbi:MAG: hypothetical protein Q4G39_01625 [Brachymonas sp.]|nr:hypothetical protein [Brachymonas sp.]